MNNEHHHHQPVKTEKPDEQEGYLKYTCPMHPQVIKDAPGKCPICGMDLVSMRASKEQSVSHKQQEHLAHRKHEEHNGYNKHAGHRTEDFLKRFWICVSLTIPVLVFSHMIQEWFSFHIVVPGDTYLLSALSSIIYFYGGWPFLKGMVGEIRSKNIGMMTLVAVAITVAFVYSVATVFGLKGMDFFWELATLIDIMLLGHWLEMRSQMVASKALQSLVALLPNTVHVERNGQVTDIDLKDLKNDEIVIVKPGEKIPADGLVLDGHTSVNESMLTGESLPVEKEKDAKVIGGSINGDGSIKLKVTGIGQDSYLNKVINLVQSAQEAKSRTQNLADQVAKWLTIVSIIVGTVTFLFWFSREKDISFALERMVTVMVTSCPHALGVAIPLVVAISTSVSAVNGLLIRNLQHLRVQENLRRSFLIRQEH